MSTLITLDKVKVDVTFGSGSGFPSVWGLAYGKKIGRNKYCLIHPLGNCRSYLPEFIYAKKVKGYHPMRTRLTDTVSDETGQIRVVNREYDDDKTNIIVYKIFINSQHREEFLEKLEKEMELLWSREKKAGLPKTRVYLEKKEVAGLVKDTGLVMVFRGSKLWQSHTWKLSIYTRYIKKVTFPEMTEYWTLLKRYEDVLLKHIKTYDADDEPVPNVTPKNLEFSQSLVHNNTGFVAILTGHNEVMRERLLGKENPQKVLDRRNEIYG